jgi:RHS repeat-associated protein
MSPGNGYTQHDQTTGVTLSVTPTQADPDVGQTTYYRFWMCANSNASWSNCSFVYSGDSGWIASSSWSGPYPPGPGLPASFYNQPFYWGVEIAGTNNPGATDLVVQSTSFNQWTLVNRSITDVGGTVPLVSPPSGLVWSPPSTVTLVAGPATVADPDGDTLWYRFVVREKGAAGVAVRSCWIQAYNSPYGAQCGVMPSTGNPNTSWTIPSDAPLEPGMAYEWNVEFMDEPTHFNWYLYQGNPQGADPLSYTRDARFEQRLGGSGPSPFQSAGPVSVNLANSNVYTSISTVTQPTATGTLGSMLEYNSNRHDSGLRGHYVGPGGATMERIDPTINFNWGTAGPSPTFPVDGFSAAWTGWITPDVTGDYYIGAGGDDNVSVTITGTTVLSQTCCTPIDAPLTGTGYASGNKYMVAVHLVAGTPAAIQVNYTEASGPAYIALYESLTSAAGMSIVPSSWLAPDTTALPPGWSLDTAAGQGAEYVSAEVQSDQVVLRRVDGDAVAYVKNADGTGYTPPVGETDHVTVLANQKVELTAADGAVYRFATTGELEAYTPASDSDVSTPVRAFATVPLSTAQRVQTLTDPISGKQLTYAYYGSIGTCPVPSGSYLAAGDSRLIGKLCRITRSDNATTDLFYIADATQVRLARVVNPGGQTTDYGWTNGQLTTVRTPNLYDLVSAGQTAAADSYWTLAYGGPTGQVSAIAAPKAAVGATAQTIQVIWSASGLGTFQTAVKNPALDTLYGASAWDRLVQYDGAARWTGDWSARGTTTFGSVTNSLEKTASWWLNADLLRSSTATGRTTIYTYDSHNWLTDTYGPAPASCFTTQVPETPTTPPAVPPPPTPQTPNGTCTNPPVPHTHTDYDTTLNTDGSQSAMTGLGAAYWKSADMSGQPAGQETVVKTGAFTQNWTTTAPTSISTAGQTASGTIPGVTDNWTERLTGEINLNATGAWGFWITLADTVDTASLYIDDLPTITMPTGNTGQTVWYGNVNDPLTGLPKTLTAGWHRIRIQYTDISGNASLQLNWNSPSTGNQVVDGSNLRPAYGLSTRSTTDGSLQAPGSVTQTRYDEGIDPAYGLATSTVQDPAGLALKTSTGYDTTLRRRTSRTLPSGAVTNYAYYGNTETSPAVTCPDGSTIPAGVNQAGLLHTATSAAPASGPAIVNETIYDVIGRPVATRTGTDAWTCTVYDTRGRVAKAMYPANANAPARTVTNTYNDATTPQTTSSSDSAGTITTTTDFLGRVTAYTDVYNKTTSTTYDAAGRTLRRYGPYVGATATSNGLEYTYDRGGFVTQVNLDGQPIAIPTYTPGVLGGEPATVSYPSGTGKAGNGTSLASIGRDQYGQTSSLTFNQANGTTLLGDTVTRGTGGEITSDTIDGTTVNYWYDSVGRLRAATGNGHGYRYVFAGQDNCGSANAGRNTNRTALIDTNTATNTAAATAYCYDNADRLTATGSQADYTTRMTALAPAAWYRLGEASGTAATDSSGNAQTGTYGGTITYGSTTSPTGNASANTSITLAATGNISVPSAVTNGTTKTISAWFKTTSSGVIVSRESVASGTTPSSGWNPFLYIGTDGKLRALASPGTINPITTSVAMNDGDWHHAVLVMDGTAQTQTLYVDGNATGQLTGIVSASPTLAFGYIGTGYTSGWPSSNGGWMPFTGSIDDVAIWNTALTATQIANLDSPTFGAQAIVPTYDAHGNTITEGIEPLAHRDTTATNTGTGANTVTITRPAATAPGDTIVATLATPTVGESSRYEAESATLNGGQVIQNTACPCSNDLNIGGWAPTNGTSAQFTVTARTAGSRTLSFRGSAGAGAASRKILVNGATAVANLSFPATSSWFQWEAVTATVTLAAGTNTITVIDSTTDGSVGWIDLDYLDVRTGNSAFTAEAEWATLTGPLVTQSAGCPCSNTSNVGGFAPTNGNAIAFSVSAPSAGIYTLAFRYSGGTGASSRKILVNGATAVANLAYPATTSWSDWRTVTTTATLTAGTNTITVIHSSTDGSTGWVNLDSVDLTPPGTATGTTPTLTAPAGWQPLTSSAGPGVTVYAWTHLAAVNDPTSWVFALSQPAKAAASASAFAGTATATPVDASAVANTATASTSQIAPSVTAASTGELLLTVVASAGSTTATPAAGMTERADTATPTGGAPTSLQTATQNLTVSGATGTRTATTASSVTAALMSIVVRPGPATTSYTYDVADRHLVTTGGATTLTYTRDLTNRIIARNNSGTVTKQGYSDSGDVGTATLDSTGTTVTERTIALPGGVLITKRTTADVWSYPNIHGDIAAAANAAGVKQGADSMYDPFGNALGTIIDNQADSIDYDWLGQHQRLSEHANTIRPVTEMGARIYDPGLARFLQVDPIPGGSATDYDYANQDPINGLDLAGTCTSHHGIFGRLRDVGCHTANTLNHDVGRAGWRNRGTIASLGATAGCAVPVVGWAGCAGLQAGAFAVRAQQRGVTHFRENAADLTLSVAVFGLVGGPSDAAGEGLGLSWWGQRALNTVTSGAVSGAGYLGAYVMCHHGPSC